ncbi:MAG TPA: A24 family peptidase [Bryobacteraceae bacterium]|nr:A24 family peptidase [Bryobacteraceae bacterium]
MLAQPSLYLTGEILLGILVSVAAVYDIRYRRIPNWLVLAAIVAGFTWNALSSGGPGLGRAAAGLGLGFVLYFPLYLIRGRRAGDVKLLAAVGAITGPGNCFWVFLLTAILGGLIALVVVMIHKRASHTFFNVGWIVRDLLRFKAPYKSSEELDVTSDKGLRVPHAAMMAVGACAFILIAQYGPAI